VAKHRYQHIRRLDQPAKATPQKRDVAEYIDQQIDDGEWPMQLSRIADETGYSRSHVQNTLDDLYERVENGETARVGVGAIVW